MRTQKEVLIVVFLTRALGRRPGVSKQVQPSRIRFWLRTRGFYAFNLKRLPNFEALTELCNILKDDYEIPGAAFIVYV